MATQEKESSPRACSVQIAEDRLVIELVDGRVLSVPLGWFPRLEAGSTLEREIHTLIGQGSGILWPMLDEHLSVPALVAGRRSAESDSSLRRWLERRQGSPAALR